jgi:hypothetical protein
MSLTEDLTKRREESRAMIPPDALAVMDKATDELLRSGIVEQSLKPGESAPDFVLPNALGKEVSLAGLLNKGPLVLSFYRGGW